MNLIKSYGHTYVYIYTQSLEKGDSMCQEKQFFIGIRGWKHYKKSL